jgi:ABC-type polysaccharide/polyol phosphate transport system ATPase subunit
MQSNRPGIECERVWKKFARGEMHDSLRDLVPALAKRLLGRGPESGELAGQEFWALRDVSFEVGPGETLGIIGANGAGKSTVLKTITKILRPNRGRCAVRGRIGALIEVSAGFHPDLTGRENIFLQGAIMNMPVELTRRRFDDIVDFSGISDFLDTPVKRYSSGMNARLGFSIAAHLDPDVLIIDEVLSVGDYAFQRRAFERIGALARSGIPVVVVSHQLDRIAELCTKAILLERGRVVAEGSPTDCIGAYIIGQTHAGDATAHACPVAIETVESESGETVRSGDPVRLRVTGKILRPVEESLYHVALRVRALSTGHFVFSCDSTSLHVPMPDEGPFTVLAELEFNVPPGNYIVESSVWDPDRQRDAFTGPSLMVAVEKGIPFDGLVQMNPRMRVLDDQEAYVVEGP